MKRELGYIYREPQITLQRAAGWPPVFYIIIKFLLVMFGTYIIQHWACSWSWPRSGTRWACKNLVIIKKKLKSGFTELLFLPVNSVAGDTIYIQNHEVSLSLTKVRQLTLSIPFYSLLNLSFPRPDSNFF